MGSTLLYSEIGSRLSKEDYSLLDVIYDGNRTYKIKYSCPYNHVSIVTWKNWTQGRRCRLCRLREFAKSKRTPISKIRDALSNEGYELLSVDYKNNRTPFKYKCPKGHVGSITWINWHHNERCSVCKFINMSGDKHHAWKGGISCEPYCDAWADKEYKKSILERDSHRCQNPDCRKTTDRLTIHHIDYNKKNCSPENLITVCRSCNARANFDREWHTLWYKIVMNIKQGYTYDRKN